MAINFPSTSGQATDGSFTHTASGITWAWDGTTWKATGVTSSYTLPTAAANVKGGVKIGSGLTMTSETLSADASAITVQEEGSSLSTAATTLNFTGAGATASGTGAVKTINIPGGGGGATDKIEELNSSVEVVDTGTDGRVLITLDNEEKFEFNETVDGKGGWFTVKGGGASGEGAKLTIDGGTGGGISFFNPKTTGGTEEYNLPTAYPTVNGQFLSATTGGVMSWVAQSAALDTRSTFTATTASLANNVAGNIEVTAHKSYSLLKIKPSIAAWVTLYVDAASRTADSNRVQGADPAPDAGVIAEVITTAANQEIKMSPAVLGWHQDAGNDAVDTVFCKVVNKSGSTGTCTVSLTVVQLEA